VGLKTETTLMQGPRSSNDYLHQNNKYYPIEGGKITQPL
jgi:hypothetical protein